MAVFQRQKLAHQAMMKPIMIGPINPKMILGDKPKIQQFAFASMFR